MDLSKKKTHGPTFSEPLVPQNFLALGVVAKRHNKSSPTQVAQPTPPTNNSEFCLIFNHSVMQSYYSCEPEVPQGRSTAPAPRLTFQDEKSEKKWPVRAAIVSLCSGGSYDRLFTEVNSILFVCLNAARDLFCFV